MCMRGSVSAHDSGLDLDTTHADGHQRCGVNVRFAVARVAMRHRRHRKPDCRHHIENCGTCGEKGHTSQVCSSGQSTNANARAVEVDFEDTEEDPIKEIHDVWAITVCTTTKHTLHESSEDNSSMIMDSGAEEHVVTRADCQRLVRRGTTGRRGGGEEGALLQLAQVRLRSATCDDMEVL